MSFSSAIITISVIFISAFLFLTVFFFRKAKKIKVPSASRRGEGEISRPEILKEHWQAILDHLNSVNESEWKLAVIEADKLIDDLLIQKGYRGESMAERLSLIDKKDLRSLELIWEAHKIRNRIAHQLNFKINRSEALRAISYYEEALKDLERLAP